ncbi:transcription factor domain-containing protein [Aspergillus affinis]|uniref:transcription factor domain-containing protein n=1 Tax=Aspergillus affinis TaxID=1070780 RepID=UPI0022FDF6D2|nr:fungal-specific transcription factor domain-containing protein [Aspergillus affinis]KAI9039923.1 fungal-specific transcription factor domain-containing protein [Aspergillus affinis]
MASGSFTATLTPPGNDSTLIKRHTSALALEKLHHHFFLEVVPRFRWIDLPENSWRNTIQPLARHSLCLQLAVAGHAAAHLSITWMGSVDERDRFRSVCQELRDSCLRMLNESMRSDLLSNSDSTKRYSLGSSPLEVLADTLLLCYADAFIPGSTDWRLHLRACQTVISSNVLQDRLGGLNSASETFLLKEVADLEILSGISVFNQKSSPITDSFFQELYSDSP